MCQEKSLKVSTTRRKMRTPVLLSLAVVRIFEFKFFLDLAREKRAAVPPSPARSHRAIHRPSIINRKIQAPSRKKKKRSEQSTSYFYLYQPYLALSPPQSI